MNEDLTNWLAGRPARRRTAHHRNRGPAPSHPALMRPATFASPAQTAAHQPLSTPTSAQPAPQAMFAPHPPTTTLASDPLRSDVQHNAPAHPHFASGAHDDACLPADLLKGAL